MDGSLALEKESNLSVKLYSSVYERMSEDIGDDFSVEDLLSVNHMAMLEKTRWNRFYMSNGWVFGKKNKPEKVHDGILSCAAIYHRAERGWHGEAKYAGYCNYPLYDFGNVIGVYKKTVEGHARELPPPATH